MQENSFSTSLDKLEQKIGSLLDDYHQKKLELEESKRKIQELESVVARQEEAIKNFHNQEKINKIAEQVTVGEKSSNLGENTKLKLKLNEYIKEIDKCIALLSE